MSDKKSGFMNFMDTTAGGAATGGLMDGIGSLFTIGAQKRAATTAYKRQKEFWNMQNAYNTPKAQMQRLKDAGLNPALMYGKGNVGNAMQLSSVGKADVSGPNLAQSAAAGAQLSLINAQRRKIEAEANNIEEDTGLKGAQKNSIEIQNSIDGMREKGMRENEAVYIEGLVSSWKENKSRADIVAIDKELKDAGFHDKYMPTIIGGLLGFEISDLDKTHNYKLEIFGKTFNKGFSNRDVIKYAVGLFLAGKALGDIINPFNKILKK